MRSAPTLLAPAAGANGGGVGADRGMAVVAASLRSFTGPCGSPAEPAPVPRPQALAGGGREMEFGTVCRQSRLHWGRSQKVTRARLWTYSIVQVC